MILGQETANGVNAYLSDREGVFPVFPRQTPVFANGVSIVIYDPADYHTVSIQFDTRYLSAHPAGIYAQPALLALSEDDDTLDDVFVSMTEVFPHGEQMRFFWPRKHVISLTLHTGGMTDVEIVSYVRSLRIEVLASRIIVKKNRFGSSTENRGSWLPLDLIQVEIHI